MTWLHQRARDALARFDKAVSDGGSPRFVALGPLSIDIGGYNDDQVQRALLAGLMIPARGLPEAPRSTGKVVWDNAAPLTIPLISAAAALKQLAAEGTGTCPGCPPLQATEATFTTSVVSTTRGDALVPAWHYFFKDTPFNLTTVAFPTSAVIRLGRMSPGSINAPPGRPTPLTIDSATTSAPSRQLSVTFTGAGGPASQPCGADYTTEALESENAVAVIIIEHGNATSHVCSPVGYQRTAIVNTARPLGDRAVLETNQGLPVPVTITK